MTGTCESCSLVCGSMTVTLSARCADFAPASGDLRNVVKTIAAIPSSYSNTVSVVINDRDFDIVARNAILLLIAFFEKDAARAADAIIHVWYSAMLLQRHVDLLSGSLRNLIEEVCGKIAGKAPNTILGKTWRFRSGSLRLELTKQQWTNLLSYFEIPSGLTAERAQEVRTAITLAHGRRDHRDRAAFTLCPGHRVSMMRFREDGILLQFGASRESFTSPNPTMFQAADWPIRDSADPLDGWHHVDLYQTPYGPASNDMYGKLYSHVRSILLDFHKRLSSTTTEFRLLSVDAQALDKYLDDETFARVEVSLPQS